MKRIGDVLRDNLPRRVITTPPQVRVKPPECPICNDAGYLRVDVDVDHPDFGKLVECTCIIEKRNQRNRAAMDRRSSLNAFHGSTFEDFDIDLPGVQDAYDAAVRFAEGAGKP